jgi:uncharacterized membrane protein YoaT (DUF817 family)
MSFDAPGAPAPHSRFYAVRRRLEQMAVVPGWRGLFLEFTIFVFKQGWACLFGALMLAGLLLSGFWWPAGLPVTRYDGLTIYAVLIQVGMLAFRLETLREAAVIFIFHVVGTAMELFKTSTGSWLYPGTSLLHIGAVPLFSGFMYASVGSYIARVWRGFDFRFTGYPPKWTTMVLATGIYINFFADHWIFDFRLVLLAVTALLFWRTSVSFRPLKTDRSMPLLIGFFLVALFIWFAENIGTFAHAWTYPNQLAGWHPVPPAKLGSWYLLMIISFVLVSLVTPVRAPVINREDAAGAAPANRARQAA